jgi:hypothetical protein
VHRMGQIAAHYHQFSVTSVLQGGEFHVLLTSQNHSPQRTQWIATKNHNGSRQGEQEAHR